MVSRRYNRRIIRESRALAGSLLIILSTVMIGGASLLSLLLTDGSGYMLNLLRQNLWRAGHAHAGVYLASVGAVVLAAGVVTLGIGLIRAARRAGA